MCVVMPPKLAIEPQAHHWACRAYMPNDELQHPVVVSCNTVEIQLMHANKLSSVFCEVKHARLAVQTVVSQLGPAAVGKVIVYTGDYMSDLLKKKGTVDVFPEVFELFSFAAAHVVTSMCIWTSYGNLGRLVHCCMRTCCPG